MVDVLNRPWNAITVHEPHGFIALTNQCGNDLNVVNAARVSYDKQSWWETNDDNRIVWGEHGPKLTSADEGLIKFLMKGKHGTPFEQNYFQFHVRAPIFVFREWHRHRIGISINEESGRYVELRGDFYIPDDDHVRVQVGKPGHYTYEPGTAVQKDASQMMLRAAYHQAYGTYQNLLDMGIAKEIARACLPVATYSQMLWTCNARSLMAFLALRNHEKALRELRDYAQVMEGVFAKVMPATYTAFVENGRVAP